MFVRMCPYLPFSARICLNQHHWLANRLRESGIRFKQVANAFLKCAAPDRLQAFANSLIPRDLLTCSQKWLAHLTPFFTAREREEAGCRHRLFFSQVEFCDNLVFRRRSALDQLGERLLDANRTIGQPKKITMIFGRKITKYHRGKLQTEIEDMDLPNPVIRSHYGTTRPHARACPPSCARSRLAIPGSALPRSTPPSSKALRQSIRHLTRSAVAPLRPLPTRSAPKVSSPSVREANSRRLSSSLTARVTRPLHSSCLKLFEHRVYAPLSLPRSILTPRKRSTAKLESQRRSQLDRLYQRVVDDLDTLVRAVGLKAA